MIAILGQCRDTGGIPSSATLGAHVIVSVRIVAPSIVSSAALGSHVLRVISRSTFADQVEDDLDVFFNQNDFADQIVVTHLDGSVDTVTGIFDEDGQTVDLQGDTPVMTTEPQFQAKVRAFRRLPAVDSLARVRGRLFRVREAEPDGTGAVTVRLLRN